MSKKASLKDAFVRSLPSQVSVEPEVQEAVNTASQPEAVFTEHQVSVEPAPPPAPPMPARPVYTAPPVVQPPAYPAVQISAQPVIQPDVHTANPLPVPRLIPKKKATFNLDASLHQRLKVAAAVHSREMVDIVEDALLKYLPNLDHSANQGIAR